MTAPAAETLSGESTMQQSPSAGTELNAMEPLQMSKISSRKIIMSIAFAVVVATATAAGWWGGRLDQRTEFSPIKTNALPQLGSTILEFNAIADGAVISLRIGRTDNCNLMADQFCELQNLVEIYANGKLVHGIGVGFMNQLQRQALKASILAALPRLNTTRGGTTIRAPDLAPAPRLLFAVARP